MTKRANLLTELATAGASAIHGWMPERDDLYFEARWPAHEGEERVRIFCRSAHMPHYYTIDLRGGGAEESFLPDWHGLIDLVSYGRVAITIGSPRERWEPDLEVAMAAEA